MKEKVFFNTTKNFLAKGKGLRGYEVTWHEGQPFFESARQFGCDGQRISDTLEEK